MNPFAKIGIDNIQRIQFDKFEKDFSFIVNGQVYKTNKFVANILSPHISNLFEGNMNLSYYKINTEDEGDFNRIIKYGEMKEINIKKKEEKQYFRSILKQLGNGDEVLRFSKKFQENISIENAIQRLQSKKKLKINFDEEISFISSNFHDFYTLYPEVMSKLDVDSIEQILTNDKLKLYNEEEVFDLILKLYLRSNDYSQLFSYVIFMNLSKEYIQEFTENFDINDMNKAIWKTICCRLEQDICKESVSAYQASHHDFLKKRYLRSKYQHNIIQYLSKQCHGNVQAQNIIRITSSSTYSDDYKVENVLEKNDNKIFGSKDIEDSWIQFDFKERKVLLDSYTLKTINNFETACHLKSWVLEVSDDGQNYTEIDRQFYCDLICGPLKTETFPVCCSCPHRFVRLMQTEENWGGSNSLWINQIEFSGFIYE